MNVDEIRQTLHECLYFEDIQPDQLQLIAEHANYMHLSKDDYLIHENNVGDSLYVIVQGKFAVVKESKSKTGSSSVVLGALYPSDITGELALFDQPIRSASVVATKNDSAVIEIKFDDLKRYAPASFFLNIAKKLSNQTRHTNDVIITHLQMDLEKSERISKMGRFIAYVLVLMSFYGITSKVFTLLSTNPQTAMFASTGIIMVFTIALGSMILRMGYQLSDYGVTMQSWRESVKESLLYTSILLILATILKWILVRNYYTQTSLFDMQMIIPEYTVGSFDYNLMFISGFIVYGIFAILQEFVARGIILTSLEDFLHKTWLANFITSGIFASMHVHLSSQLALIVFLPSLFWGWLYMRHRTIIGPAISHIIIGWWGIFVLGLQDLFK